MVLLLPHLLRYVQKGCEQGMREVTYLRPSLEVHGHILRLSGSTLESSASLLPIWCRGQRDCLARSVIVPKTRGGEEHKVTDGALCR